MVLLSSVAKTSIRFFNQEIKQFVRQRTGANNNSRSSELWIQHHGELLSKLHDSSGRSAQRGNISCPLLVERSTNTPASVVLEGERPKPNTPEFRTVNSMLQNIF